MASKVWCVRSCVQDRDIAGVRTLGLHQFVLRGRFGARWALEQKKKKKCPADELLIKTVPKFKCRSP